MAKLTGWFLMVVLLTFMAQVPALLVGVLGRGLFWMVEEGILASVQMAIKPAAAEEQQMAA
jgi:hypothetical protein